MMCNSEPEAEALAPAAYDVPQRAGGRARNHHLLKHTLPEGDVLTYFGTIEPKEIAKEISKMGQRELQAKFREVYKAQTFSNNNNWLRRKLMEAAGVQAPKAQGRGRPSGQRSPAKAPGSRHSAVPPVAGVPAGHGFPTSSPGPAEGSKHRAQVVAGEPRRTQRKFKPSRYHLNMEADTRADSVSSDDTSKSLERLREVAKVNTQAATQQAFTLGLERAKAESQLGYDKTELLAKYALRPKQQLGGSADMLSLLLHSLNSPAEPNPLYSPYGPAPVAFPGRLSSPPCSPHTGLIAQCQAMVRKHAGMYQAASPVNHESGESDVTIGTYGHECQPLGDMRTPHDLRRSTSFDSITSGALLDMRSASRPNTALQWDQAAYYDMPSTSAVPFLPDLRYVRSPGMCSEPQSPLGSFIPSTAAQSPFSGGESCCGLDDEDNEDAVMHSVRMLLAPPQDPLGLSELVAQEALAAIEQKLREIGAEEQQAARHLLSI